MTTDQTKRDEGEEYFEKFLKDKSLSNEKEPDAWGVPDYKHSHIRAMWYAWQECWKIKAGEK